MSYVVQVIGPQEQAAAEEEAEGWVKEGEGKEDSLQDQEGLVYALNVVTQHLTQLVYLAINRLVLNAEPL